MYALGNKRSTSHPHPSPSPTPTMRATKAKYLPSWSEVERRHVGIGRANDNTPDFLFKDLLTYYINTSFRFNISCMMELSPPSSLPAYP